MKLLRDCTDTIPALSTSRSKSAAVSFFQIAAALARSISPSCLSLSLFVRSIKARNNPSLVATRSVRSSISSLILLAIQEPTRMGRSPKTTITSPQEVNCQSIRIKNDPRKAAWKKRTKRSMDPWISEAVSGPILCPASSRSGSPGSCRRSKWMKLRGVTMVSRKYFIEPCNWPRHQFAKSRVGTIPKPTIQAEEVMTAPFALSSASRNAPTCLRRAPWLSVSTTEKIATPIPEIRNGCLSGDASVASR
ncbi:MAG: hypothetical protein ACOY3K_05080 [Candidatus Omnitrophota bacterium]